MSKVCTLFIICLFICKINPQLFAAEEDKKSETPPNIIFIMSDDHAKQAISCYGSRINQTPNIDRIANEGIRFERAFVTNSICAPSRAVALTGKYSHINGLRDNRDTFNGEQMTFPKLLQEAGYQTALIGKWHLKTTPTGFDYWKILPGQGAYYNPKFIEMGDTLKYSGYVSNLITDFAIDALENFDKNRPFCLLYFHKAPHRNWMPDINQFI
jgi:arylsulfatase A-like enzyme